MYFFNFTSLGSLAHQWRSIYDDCNQSIALGLQPIDFETSQRNSRRNIARVAPTLGDHHVVEVVASATFGWHPSAGISQEDTKRKVFCSEKHFGIGTRYKYDINHTYVRLIPNRGVLFPGLNSKPGLVSLWVHNPRRKLTRKFD